MRFGVLGPLQVAAGSTEVTLARRERVLLAVLLLHANRVVGPTVITDAVWGDRPPADAAGQVHAAVYRLRKKLAAAGLPRELVGTDPAGYQLRVEPRSVDLLEFRELRDRARDSVAGGDLDAAAAGFRAALAGWRGPALAGVDSDLVRRAATGLDEERLQATEECLEAELALGRGRELVAELTELVGQHPHREGLHRALMLALYRAGRQGDALAAYRRTRQLLQDELGIEPGAELQRMHQAILNRVPDLDPPTPSTTARPAPPARPVPRELPADVSGFTGRADALKALDELLTDAPEGAPVVISAIAGTAGVGKTALATHWAHQHPDRFPDGQLYINLRGYDPGRPVEPSDALGRLLASLGVAAKDVPLEADERVARFRSEVAGRRVLVVLDNAATSGQVRPLLPGSGTCTVVVTSRDSLSGLVAVDGAQRLDLDLLPPPDAFVLLRRLIGDRVEAEPAAAAELAELCARLPLALRVAAELAASRPEVPLADLALELSDRQRRLELLDVSGDPHAAVRSVFSWSVRHLPDHVVRVFALVGLHPGPDFDACATATLAGIGLEEARHTLELLERAHLVSPARPGRYGMHDLLRAYAADQARQTFGAERQAALTRLFDYYLAAAGKAIDILYPAESNRRPSTPAPIRCAPADAGAARAWLEVERACLVAMAVHSATGGWPGHAIRLSAVVYRYLVGGHYEDALAIHGQAILAAETIGDLAAQAHALRRQGSSYLQLGQYVAATEHHQRALELFHRAKSPIGEAAAYIGLGTISRRQGGYSTAAQHYERALTLYQDAGDDKGEATAQHNLGMVERRQGRYTRAMRYHERALEIYERLQDAPGQAYVLTTLGMVEERLGRYVAAMEHHEKALMLFRDLGHGQGIADTLENIGTVHMRLGEAAQANAAFGQALSGFRELGDRAGESWALNGLGEVAGAEGNPIRAITYHSEALATAIETGTRDQQARAYAGRGAARHALDSPATARRDLEDALAIFAELDMPEWHNVRTRLVTLTQQTSPDDDRTE